MAFRVQPANAMNRPYDIKARTFLFACEIVDFCRPVMPPGAIVRELARQLLRSATSIGANIEEAAAGQSKPDFRSKVAISRKEARESAYWLRLLVHADRRLKEPADSLLSETGELIKILTTIKLNSERHDRSE